MRLWSMYMNITYEVMKHARNQLGTRKTYYSIRIHGSYIYTIYMIYIHVYTVIYTLGSQTLNYPGHATKVALEPAYAEKYFPNCIKSNRNQIIFTMHRLIWNTNGHVRLLFQINRRMVNTIWVRFDLIRFGKYFSVCTRMRKILQHKQHVLAKSLRS